MLDLLKKAIRKLFKATVWPLILYCFPKLAVTVFYKVFFGKYPNLKHPVTFNEKLQCLKIGPYYRDPFIHSCIDKYLVKSVLLDHFKQEELKYASVYAAFDSVEAFFAAGFDRYPDRFVVKCNHGCGYNYLCADKSKLDVADLKEKLTAWFSEDYWKKHVEYQYRFIKKKIFVEEYLENIGNTFKFYCFSGKPEFLYISNPDAEGNADVYLDFLDMDLNLLPVSLADHLHSGEKFEKTEVFEKMCRMAQTLSAPFPFVRVDLYEIAGGIGFSEFTFLPTGGYMRVEPESILTEWGNLLDLNYTAK